MYSKYNKYKISVWNDSNAVEIYERRNDGKILFAIVAIVVILVLGHFSNFQSCDAVEPTSKVVCQ